MGCDIHCYIEHRAKNDPHWQSFGGRINPGRSYGMFGRLAGVRRDGALVEPRGLPESLGWESASDSKVYIVEGVGDAPDGCCRRSDAERWVASGSSTLCREGKAVTHPDWHTPSWLTPNEWEAALMPESLTEYRAVLAAMRSFETAGEEARIVFWFDN